jgi:SAM-dependent methyltransferase
MEKIERCPVCDGSEYGDSFVLGSIEYRLSACGAVWAVERMSDEELEEYYGSGEYREISDKRNGDDWEREHQERRAKNVKSFLGDRIYSSHLDIGCSSGELLRTIGCMVQEGVDLDPKWTVNVPVLYRYLGQVDRQYELVTMIHILEHLCRPRSYMREAAKRVKVGGTLVVEVPNRRAYMAAYAHPVHVVAYDGMSLIWLLKDAGLEIEDVILHGGGVSVLDLYLLAIAKKVKET